MEKLFPDEEVIITKHFGVHQDWEIPIPGFFILAPHRKMRSVTDFTDEEAVEFIMLLRKVRAGMRDILGISDVYLFQNEDTEHGFHLWIFPRLAWMERFGRKIQSVRPIMNYAREQMNTDEVKTQVVDWARKMRHHFQQSI